MLRRRLGALSVCALALALPSAADADRPIPDQYIVVLKDGSSGRSAAADHRRSAGAHVLHTYDHALHGYAARLSAAGLARVKADPRVDRVVPDTEGPAVEAQSLPTGVNRIDADLSAAAEIAGNGDGAVVPGDVAVVDTGIDVDHPDLNVPGGVNCLGPVDAYNDGTIDDAHGHGTHVAGIIGAKDDTNGVVGVAPGVRVWAVRVGDRLGVAQASEQLCGIDWVTANGPSLGIKVVNASMVLVGSNGDSACGGTDVLHNAVCNSTAAGITWVFAAGNSTVELATAGGAGYDEVLTVTAMADSNGQPNVGSTTKITCTSVLKSNSKDPSGNDDTYTSFSNWTGRAAEQAHVVAAPGLCINSTFKAGTYGLMSGTSMASPHAAGTMHLCIVSGQCSGVPAENIQKVHADAQAYTTANPSWGFKGDPLRPVTGRYYGYLVRAGQY